MIGDATPGRHRPPAGRAPSAWLRLVLRVATLGLMLLLFHASEWTGLRRLVRALILAILPLFGHTAVAFDSAAELALMVDGGEPLAVTAPCTYLDLWLVSAPFVWRFHRTLIQNGMALMTTAAAVLLVNLVRIVAVIHLAALGYPLSVVHHGSDWALHAVWIGAWVLAAVRADNPIAASTRAMERIVSPAGANVLAAATSWPPSSTDRR